MHQYKGKWRVTKTKSGKRWIAWQIGKKWQGKIYDTWQEAIGWAVVNIKIEAQYRLWMESQQKSRSM